MVKKRLIFTLLMNEENFMLSRNFNLQTVGNLEWLKEYYDYESLAYSVDELIVLNVSRNKKNIIHFSNQIKEISKTFFSPLSAGGGISNLKDAYTLLDSGADRVIVNTLLFEKPELIRELVNTFGSQCIVASIDYKEDSNNIPIVFSHNGTINTNMSVYQVIKYTEQLDVGEVYLNSIQRDGTGQGYDIDLLKKINNISKVPVIASGGVGRFDHLLEGIRNADCSAVSTANLFNFMADGLIEARKFLLENNIDLAKWDILDNNIYQNLKRK